MQWLTRKQHALITAQAVRHVQLQEDHGLLEPMRRAI
jgi:hypothetical protein